MRIGIITFHASFNYGSMLQAYALHKVLSDMGHNVEIINFRSAEQRNMYHHPINLKSKEWSKIHMLMHYMLHINTYIPHIKKWNLYNAFLKKYLTHTKVFHTVDELRQFDFKYDYLVIGSDQIWNTRCRDFSEAYWGNFCDKKIKKIAYAPSMGSYPELQDINHFKDNLSNFFAVSVREIKARKILIDNQVFHDISLTLDPTLLLKDIDYNYLAPDNPLINGDYLFFYEPFIRPDFLKIALDFGIQLGYNVVVDRSYQLNSYKGYNNIIFYTEVGPKEFVNLIKHAKVVIGHSLHAVLFSIIFRKNFYAIDGDKDSRMNTVLVSLGLEKRAICLDNLELQEKEDIDYWESVYEKYSIMKNESISFIKKALNESNV